MYFFFKMYSFEKLVFRWDLSDVNFLFLKRAFCRGKGSHYLWYNCTIICVIFGFFFCIVMTSMCFVAGSVFCWVVPLNTGCPCKVRFLCASVVKDAFFDTTLSQLRVFQNTYDFLCIVPSYYLFTFLVVTL